MDQFFDNIAGLIRCFLSQIVESLNHAGKVGMQHFSRMDVQHQLIIGLALVVLSYVCLQTFQSGSKF